MSVFEREKLFQLLDVQENMHTHRQRKQPQLEEEEGEVHKIKEKKIPFSSSLPVSWLFCRPWSLREAGHWVSQGDVRKWKPEKEEGLRDPMKEQRRGQRTKQPHFPSAHRHRRLSPEEGHGARVLPDPAALEVPYRNQAGGTEANTIRSFTQPWLQGLPPMFSTFNGILGIQPSLALLFGQSANSSHIFSFTKKKKKPKKERVNYSKYNYSLALKDVSENAEQAKVKIESGDWTQVTTNVVSQGGLGSVRATGGRGWGPPGLMDKDLGK